MDILLDLLQRMRQDVFFNVAHTRNTGNPQI